MRTEIIAVIARDRSSKPHQAMWFITRIMAEVIGDYGLHPALEGEGYVVTHVPSGVAIPLDLLTREVGEELLHVVQAVRRFEKPSEASELKATVKKWFAERTEATQ